MRIMHCCLANFYIDDYGYQENILPKMHKLQGHEVMILASTETYLSSRELGYVKASSYLSSDGIRVVRLPYVKWSPRFLSKKLRIYSGIARNIKAFEPDVIFLHDIQFLSIVLFAKHMRDHKDVKLYADGHTDFINSARNWFSKHILHKIVYRWCAKRIEPHAIRFFGVTPLRVKFFEDVYLIDKNKTDLLVMGVDDSVVNLQNAETRRLLIRRELGIPPDDFVIVSGGKIDARKNIHVLMEVINKCLIDNIWLIVFGEAVSEMKPIIDKLTVSKRIVMVGWIPPEKVYDYYFASDLGCFPGTHSVLWEQAVGVGLPCVFRRWDGIEHVDVGGNCLMINGGSYQEIKNAIISLYLDKKAYLEMKKNSLDKGVPVFSYSKIAKKAIGEQ
jgi:1,2-diacylglycerol 3-alpha-glucosyltransferase